MEITATSTTPVTPYHLFSILTTALEGGYAEEFEGVKYTRREKDSLITSATLRCDEHDVEGVNEWDLDIVSLAIGLQRYADWVSAEDPGRKTYLGQQFSEAQADGWDCFDAIGADAVLQFACFGEVVFN